MALNSDFSGTGRFAIERRLGEGGMGVVYLALDRERGGKVALKTLVRADAAGIAILKNEFRALADVTHPNVVTLHELFSEGGQWFFTMEVVDGTSFLSHVSRTTAELAGRAHDSTVASAPRAASTMTVTATPNDVLTTPIARDPSEPPPSGPLAPATRATEPFCEITRLRAALRQLAEGVCAIHAAGKLHRDLKPSNVMVTREGRVIILDFGLAGALGARRGEASSRVRVMGTPGYMAPEQTLGDQVSAAADWYAVGTMVFEALTGALPFTGDPASVMRKKRAIEPRPPSDYADGIPRDLDQLCLDCLRIDPAARPAAADVLRVLAEAEAPAIAEVSAPGEAPLAVGPQAAASTPRPRISVGVAAPITQHPATLRAPVFVGREAQLRALHEAFAEARAGRAVTVYVSGRSGMGKSALIEHFLDELWRGGEALILSGRCYQRESVPYKAWDSLVDALVRHLEKLSPERARVVLPSDIHALARVFPVLLGLDDVSDATERIDLKADRHESRRRAFDALKDLLRNLAREEAKGAASEETRARRTLVLTIDDLQWGDVDSAKLMAALLAPPDPPNVLLVCSYRSEEAEGSEFFRELDAIRAAEERPSRGRGGATLARDRASIAGDRATIAIDRMSEAEATRLAAALLGAASPALAAAIARESEGSPFFIGELVRHAEAVRAADPEASEAGVLAGVSLEGVLQGRIERLPDGARRLLEVLAVAARPLERGLAAAAAGLDRGGDGALAALRAARLARTRGPGAKDLVEAYHDRVRETAAAAMPAAALRDAHLRLARAVEAAGGEDPELLAVHLEAAGERAEAVRYAVLAAERATFSLAFDRAARLYRLALSCKDAASATAKGRVDRETQELRVKLADALVSAGLGAEAAPVYLLAAEGASAAEAVELRRRAAEQFLVTGHFDRGAEVLRSVLVSMGVGYPETSVGATLTLLGRMAKLRLRGTRFAERPAASVATDALARIDVCYSAGKGLVLVDPVRGLGFFAQHLLLSLDAGEPGRVCLGLAFHGTNICVAGGGARDRAKRLLAEARAIAERLGDPYLIGVVGNCGAAAEMCLGRWKATVELATRSNDVLREGCGGRAAWEIESGVVFCEVSLLWMGRLRELAAFVRTHVRDALDRGNLFAATYARMHTWYAPIAAGDVGRAAEEMRDAIGRWSAGGFHIMHFWALYGETQYEIYAGDARAARARLLAAWPALEGSNILRVQFHRVFMTLLRGSTAVSAALASRAGDRDKLLRAAARDADRLADEGMPYAAAASSLLRAGVVAARGRAPEALPHLDAAIAGFDAADMALHAACARRRKGEILGGGEGRALVAAADAIMTGEGIANPSRWLRIYAAGFDAD